MITAQFARELKKTVDTRLDEALERIETQIIRDAEQYNSTRYQLEEFDEIFYRQSIINTLKRFGYKVDEIDGAKPILQIRWGNLQCNG